MKKIFNSFAAIASIVLVAMPACSGKSTTTEANDTAHSAESSTTQEPATNSESADAVIEIAAATPNLDGYKDKLTVVDFNAVWCGPCRKYGPTFHAVAEKMVGKANFLSVNVDSCPKIAEKYVKQYIPQTTAILPDGRTFDKVGELSEDELTAFVDSVAAL